MVINSIQSSNLGVIPQPAPQKPRQTAFASNNNEYQPQYAQHRSSGIGYSMLNFTAFLMGAFAADRAAGKLFLDKFAVEKKLGMLSKGLISIPFLVVGGYLAQAIIMKLTKQN